MAQTAFNVNDPLTVKLFAKQLAVQAIAQTWFGKFIDEEGNSVLQMLDNAEKSAGDTVNVGLRTQLSGTGVQGDGTLQGQEEALTIYADKLLINQLRNAVNVGGRMTQQRVPFELREEARLGLQDWYAARFDTAFFNQLSGNTIQTDTRYTGNNATIAPTSGYITLPSGVATEGALGSTNTFTISLIDTAVERSILGISSNPIFRPIKVDGNDMFVIFMHPSQVTDMRQATTTGSFLDIQKAAATGGEVSNNPIFTGALGVYNQTVIHRAARCIQTITSGAFNASTRRAVFCGAQAGAIGFGRGDGKEQFTWVEELFDYGNILGVSAGSIFGIKKLVFNSADFATQIVSSYAAAH